MGLDRSRFLQHLRDETRAQHDRVEQLVPVMRENLDVVAYRRILSRFYGYHAPLESRLEALAPGLPGDLDWPARRKCPPLRSDLVALGLEERDLARLPRCKDLPDLSSTARVFGCLYVLEGATLGGQVICRHLERLEPAIAQNRRFFQGYGERTGAMWTAFRAVLVENAPTPGNGAEVVDAARETFHTFADWMSEKWKLDEC